MKDKLSPAVDALLEKLAEQQRAVSATKQMINQLKTMMGEEALFPDASPELVTGGPVRLDQYYGKGPVAAAEEFLSRRNQACGAEEIHRALEQGGFDYETLGWKPKDRVRMIAITLAKNPQKFHKLPNNTFGLPAWYPTLANRRDKPDKAAEAKAAEEKPTTGVEGATT